MQKIEYYSSDNWRGVLYDRHNDPYCGERFQMSIFSPGGREVLHSYNAKPATLEELKKVVDKFEEGEES